MQNQRKDNTEIMKLAKKSVAVLLIAAMLVCSLNMYGCTKLSQLADLITLPEQSDGNVALPEHWLEYTMTEQEFNEALDSVELLSKLTDKNASQSKLQKQLEKVDDCDEYIMHQYQVAQMRYYYDTSDSAAYRNYVTAQQYYVEFSQKYYEAWGKLADSELPYADAVLDSVSSQNENISFSVSDEKYYELEIKQDEIIQRYNELYPGSETWADDVDGLYYEFVQLNQQIAFTVDYENYYVFAAEELNNRRYTDAEKQKFRAYVKQYIVPLFLHVTENWNNFLSTITRPQYDHYYSLTYGKCSPQSIHLKGYIDSHSESVKQKMKALFDKNAIIYANSDKAQNIAYCHYSDYYREPYVFLGGRSNQTISTVIHEMGHYVAHCRDSYPGWSKDMSELHSQGNEWLMIYYLKDKIDPAAHTLFVLSELYTQLYAIICTTAVDEFEERVYCVKTPYSADQYKSLLDEISEEYGNAVDIHTYARQSVVSNPVYCFNYATSGVVAVQLYLIAEQDGYARATEIYAKIIEDVDPTLDFIEALETVGLDSPFDELSFINLEKAFS